MDCKNNAIYGVHLLKIDHMNHKLVEFEAFIFWKKQKIK